VPQFLIARQNALLRLRVAMSAPGLSARAAARARAATVQISPIRPAFHRRARSGRYTFNLQATSSPIHRADLSSRSYCRVAQCDRSAERSESSAGGCSTDIESRPWTPMSMIQQRAGSDKRWQSTLTKRPARVRMGAPQGRGSGANVRGPKACKLSEATGGNQHKCVAVNLRTPAASR
jgi:hypothetical protein